MDRAFGASRAPAKIDGSPLPGQYRLVKTMIDIPEPLYLRAEIHAAELGESLDELVIKSLEQVLNGDRAAASSSSTDAPLFSLDEFGFPVLSGREGVVVTEALINRIRQEEGI
jgi:hypothetical protein